MSSELRGRALALLARREHSRAELKRKLAARAESEEELVRLLDDLTSRRLLSDDRYASQRATLRGASYGNAKLAHELRHQGIDGETISAALAQAGDELERALAVWQKKFGTPASDAAGWAKQARFLAARGFSSEIIRRVLQGPREHD